MNATEQAFRKFIDEFFQQAFARFENPDAMHVTVIMRHESEPGSLLVSTDTVDGIMEVLAQYKYDEITETN